MQAYRCVLITAAVYSVVRVKTSEKQFSDLLEIWMGIESRIDKSLEVECFDTSEIRRFGH